ncbi:MAG: hypothetical protein PF636_08440 [Actinomycetota bacterium]|jgi:cytochrome bd-type quinol oxidase subunit 2|nr:hypothetical protein [Actinomycetota bacterium]
MIDNPYVRIVNNFLHDMATGTWAACAMVIWVLSGKTSTMPFDAAQAVESAMRSVWWLLIVALLVITVTGAFRLFYWRGQTPDDERAAKRRALVIKHVAFLVIYGGGSVWVYGLLG